MITDTNTTSHPNKVRLRETSTKPADDHVGLNNPESASKETDDSMGLSFDSYCQKYSLSSAQLWQKIRCGEVVARTHHGEMKVFGNYSPDPATNSLQGAKAASGTDKLTIDPVALANSSSELKDPPLPFPIVHGSETPRELELMPIGRISPQSPEVALLLDHLSLAKEENREILRLSQEAINRISGMAEQVLAAKEEVLAERNELLRSKELLVTAQQEQIDQLRMERKQLGAERQTLVSQQEKLQAELQAQRQKLIAEKAAALKEQELQLESMRADQRKLAEAKDNLLKEQKEHLERMRGDLERTQSLTSRSLQDREQQLTKLTEELQNRDDMIRKLQQSCEDLQMLANTLSADDH